MNNENRSKAKKEAGVRGEMEISVCAGNEKNTGIKSDAETSGRFGTTVSERFSIKDCGKGTAGSGKSNTAGLNEFDVKKLGKSNTTDSDSSA